MASLLLAKRNVQRNNKRGIMSASEHYTVCDDSCKTKLSLLYEPIAYLLHGYTDKGGVQHDDVASASCLFVCTGYVLDLFELCAVRKSPLSAGNVLIASVSGRAYAATHAAVDR